MLENLSLVWKCTSLALPYTLFSSNLFLPHTQLFYQWTNTALPSISVWYRNVPVSPYPIFSLSPNDPISPYDILNFVL